MEQTARNHGEYHGRAEAPRGSAMTVTEVRDRLTALEAAGLGDRLLVVWDGGWYRYVTDADQPTDCLVTDDEIANGGRADGADGTNIWPTLSAVGDDGNMLDVFGPHTGAVRGPRNDPRREEETPAN